VRVADGVVIVTHGGAGRPEQKKDSAMSMRGTARTASGNFFSS